MLRLSYRRLKHSCLISNSSLTRCQFACLSKVISIDQSSNLSELARAVGVACTSKSPISQLNVTNIVQILEDNNNNQIDHGDLSRLFCGLKVVPIDFVGTKSYITLLRKAIDCANSVSPSLVVTAYSSLHNFSCDIREVEELVNALNKITSSIRKLDARQFHNVLFGLKSMNSDKLAVRKTLSLLSDKLVSIPGCFSDVAIYKSFCGISDMDCKHIEVRKLFNTLAICVREAMADISPPSVAKMLYTLKNMDPQYAEVRTLIQAMNIKFEESSFVFNNLILSSLFQFQNIDSSIYEVRYLLQILANKMKTSEVPLKASYLSLAMHGLRNMRDQHDEVKAIVQALTRKIDGCTDVFTAKQLAGCYYGLKSMSSNSVEVCELLSVLNGKMKMCQEVMNPLNICNAMYGLTLMTSEPVQVREFLCIIKHHLERCKEVFSHIQIGSCLFGLRGKSSELDEVRDVVALLTDKVNNQKNTLLFNSQSAGNSLYGMQTMSSDASEVRILLSALSRCLKKEGHPPFTLQAYGNMMYGLQGMSSDYVEIREALEMIYSRMQVDIPVNLQLYSQFFASGLYGLQRMSSKHIEVQNMFNFFASRLECYDGPLFTFHEISSMFHGLSSDTGETLAARRLIRSITAKLKESLEYANSISTLNDQKRSNDKLSAPNEFKPLTAKDICNCLFGLKDMQHECREAKDVWRIFLDAIKAGGVEQWKEWMMMTDSTLKQRSGCTVSSILWTMRNFHSFDPLVRDWLHFLNKCLFHRSSSHGHGHPIILLPNELSKCMIGMRNMSSQHIEVQNILKTIRKSVQHTKDMSNQDICNSLSGLRNCSSDIHISRQIFETLCSMYLKNNIPLTGNEISGTLYGMQQMSGIHRQVRSGLDSITTKIYADTNSALHVNGKDTDLSAHPMTNINKRLMSMSQVAVALNGLRGMTSDNPNVKKLLQFLNAQIVANIIESRSECDSQDLKLLFCGVRFMKTDSVEVITILNTIYEHILLKNYSKLLIGDVAHILYGLQSLDGKEIVVQNILHLLAKHMAKQTERFVQKWKHADLEAEVNADRAHLLANEIAIAFYGLSSKNGGHRDVAGLIESLCVYAEYILSQEETVTSFNTLEYCNIVYGIIPHIANAEIHDSLISLVPKLITLLDHIIEKIDVIVKSDRNISSSESFNFLQSLVLVRHYCHFALSQDAITKLSDIIAILGSRHHFSNIHHKYHQRAIKSVIDYSVSQSKDMKLMDEIKKQITDLMSHPHAAYPDMAQRCSVQFHKVLDGFECDIHVTYLSSNTEKDEKDTYLNIEIDGPAHLLLKRQEFARLRDGYLTNRKNVQVVRVPLDEEENVTGLEIAQKCVELIASRYKE